MSGSIVKRDTGYFIVYELPPIPNKDGKTKRRQKWEKVPEPNTKKHADKLLVERLSQINKSEFIEPSKITFAEFQNIWMEKYAIGEGQIRPSTLVLYDGHFRNHLIPAFGGTVLSKIGVEDIQGFKAVKTASGLSPQTVKHLLRLLRQMLDHAIDWGYIRTNPAKKVRNPRIPRRDMDCLTSEEGGVFLNHVPDKWYPFFLTAIVTALRAGELIGMKWRNLDWNRGQYFVKETFLRPRGGHPACMAEPKTDSSMAPVDLTPSCLDALRHHRARQNEEKLQAGDKYQNQDLIFATPLGTWVHPSNTTNRVFHPTLKAAGIRQIRFHDLRHTCASLLIAQNESPKYIQTQLRHASFEMTFDRYGHLFPDSNKEAASRLDQAIFGGASRTSVGGRSI